MGGNLEDLFAFTLFGKILGIHDMKCFMEKLESLLYRILNWESLILEGGDLQLPKIGGSQRKLRGGRAWKTGQ